MYTYFKINPSDNSIVEGIERKHELENYVTKEDNQSKKPFIVPVTVVEPVYDSATQSTGGIVDTYNPSNNTATRTRRIIDITDEELAAEKRQGIINSIHILESEVTNRRLRDAILTSDGKTWLTNKEAEIATERAKL